MRHPVNGLDFADVSILDDTAELFTDEIYTNIENEQHVLTEYGFSDSPERGFGGSSGSRSTNRHVQHVLLPEKGTVYQSPQILPDSFIEKVQKLGKRQDESSKRYSENVNGEHVFFVLKNPDPGPDVSVVILCA